MKICLLLAGALISLPANIALAQNSRLPSLEQFNNILTLCAAGARISLNGEIRGNFESVYKDKVVDAKGAQFITSADFLNNLRPEDKIEALKIYQACVIAIIQGKATVDNPAPTKVNDFDLPPTIETFGRPLNIKAGALTGVSEIRAFPVGARAENGVSGSNGANGGNAGEGSRGGDGGQGTAGAPGNNGSVPGDIRIEADSFTGDLRIINSGSSGGNGGDGGAGGSGGAGGRGSGSVNGMFDCSRGPGNGGGGGNAGSGADGGRGGNGGAGGTVILKFKTVTPGSTINIVSNGGSLGRSGEPGQPGAPGRGGDRGSTGGHCGGGGRTAGANGTTGAAGRKLSDGQDGPNGQIELTVGGKTTSAAGSLNKTF